MRSMKPVAGAVTFLAFALLGIGLPGGPRHLAASDCGGYSGPECTTAETESCFNLVFVKWCSKISTKNYYPASDDDPPEELPETD